MAATSASNHFYTNRLRDALGQISDTQTVSTSSAALTVASGAVSIDVGASQMFFDAVFSLGAVDATTGDEQAILTIQGSNSSTFASGNVCLAAMPFGDSTKTGESSDNLGDERVVLSGTNVREGTAYRYVRGYVVLGGTSASMIVNDGYLVARAY